MIKYSTIDTIIRHTWKWSVSYFNSAYDPDKSGPPPNCNGSYNCKIKILIQEKTTIFNFYVLSDHKRWPVYE